MVEEEKKAKFTPKPSWLKVSSNTGETNKAVMELLQSLELHTVCEEANCPNCGECFGRKTATFMILGKNCTRNCTFCCVSKGATSAPDPEEPLHIAQAVEKLNLQYVVITSVTRDDLEDGGASHFAEVIKAIRKQGEPANNEETDKTSRNNTVSEENSDNTSQNCQILEGQSDNIEQKNLIYEIKSDDRKQNNPYENISNDKNISPKIEVLIPDFQGGEDALRAVVLAKPDVVNHNIETVSRLYATVRPQAIYQRSLELLSHVKSIDPKMLTKSGIMVGLGETKDEVLEVFKDLRKHHCDFLTIGQYLAPSSKHHPVIEYVTPEQFAWYKEQAIKAGFIHVASGPLVRSSYQAEQGWKSINTI